jgi:spore coat protein U-like protein
LSNGLTVTFSIVYACNGTGSHFDNVDPTSPDVIQGALILPVKVLSALQASYAGPAMDFGNVQGADGGTFTTFHAPTTGTSVINVKSSGPYTVDLSSANSYLLKDTSTDTIKYSLHFLGRDLTNASPSFATINCARAGVITPKQLPLKGTLSEAANAKAVASYSDTLTVTITPTNFGGVPQTCESL